MFIAVAVIAVLLSLLIQFLMRPLTTMGRAVCRKTFRAKVT